MKSLKKQIKEGKPVIGCWLNLGSSVVAEIVGDAGFDWVLIDLEHGMGSEQDVLYQLQALKHTPAAAIVRVEGTERQRIHHVLDLGAEGVMCPRIDDTADATKVMSGLQYPPDGCRGVAKVVRATGFGQNFSDYFHNTRENILGIVQIETEQVLNHLNGIAALDGVDVLFIGPSDLTMSLGIFGQFDHPLFIEAVKSTVDAALQHGKATGILLPDPDDFESYCQMGIQMIACGADVGFIAKGAQNMVKKLHIGYTEYD